jgi:hypothetical protein
MDRVVAQGQRGAPGNSSTRSGRVRETTVGKKEKSAAAKMESSDQPPQDGKLKRKEYEAKLDELHMELVKMQYWSGRWTTACRSSRTTGAAHWPRHWPLWRTGWPSDSRKRGLNGNSSDWKNERCNVTGNQLNSSRWPSGYSLGVGAIQCGWLARAAVT